MSLKITFEGGLVDLEGKTYGSEPLKKLLSLLINNFPIYPEKFYGSTVTQIGNDIRNVHWKLSAKPHFNAFMKPNSNEVGINLFAILSILAIPNISKYINDIHQKSTISIDEAKDYIENIPDSLLTDLDALFNTWAKVHEEGEQGMWSLVHFPLIQSFYFFEPIGRFLMWHEVAHWQLMKFNNHARSLLFNQTQSHIDNYIKELCGDDAASRLIVCYLDNDKVRSNWIEEITCDVMSSLSYITKF